MDPSSLSGHPPPGHEPRFYPMAKNKPFTPVIMGRAGDPLYSDPTLRVDPTMAQSLKDCAHVSINEFANFLELGASPILQIRHSIAAQSPLMKGVILAAYALVGLYYINREEFDKRLEQHPYLGSLLPSIFNIHVILATIALTVIAVSLTPIPDVADRTGKVMRHNLRPDRHPLCDMRLTDKAVQEIKTNHRFPNELKDPLTLEKITDPVTFLDREGKDTTMTIYNRTSAAQLLFNNMINQNRGQPFAIDTLVELPELKRQIEELSEDPSIQDPE